jgi:hypothetical protein
VAGSLTKTTQGLTENFSAIPETVTTKLREAAHVVPARGAQSRTRNSRKKKMHIAGKSRRSKTALAVKSRRSSKDNLLEAAQSSPTGRNKATPRMINCAKHFEEHLRQTSGHLPCLEQIFDQLNEKPSLCGECRK